MADYVLNGATVVPMTAPDDVMADGAVVVRDGAIDAVHDEPVDPTSVEHDLEVVDVDGGVVLPGLVNAHTHLYQTLLRGVWEDIPLMPWLRRVYGVADVLTPEDCYVGTQLGVAESLRAGTTTVLEHQFLNPTYEHTTATLDAMLDAGVRTVFARTVMDRGEIVPEAVREDPAAALATVERLLDDYEISPMLSIRTGPNTPPVNTTTACCEAIAAFCDRHPEVGISAHVAESPEVVDAVRGEGYDGVAEYLDAVGLTGEDCIYAHCVHLNDAEVTLVANTGTAVSHNPVSNMMLGDGVAPLVELLEAGATVGLGTDGAASNHAQDMVEVLKFTSLLHKVHHRDPAIISPYRVLELATRGGAAAVGLSDAIGTIEPGKRADLIVVDLEDRLHNVAVNDLYSAIVHTMQAADVRSTMVDGRFVVRDGTLLTADETHLVRRGQAVGRSLVDRVGELEF